MIRRFNILPGQARNLDKALAAVRAHGFYSSGKPRTGLDATTKKPVPKFRFLTSKEIRSLSRSDRERYFSTAKAAEGDTK